MGFETTCSDRSQAERLAAYELGLLDAGERAAFERHLDHCPDCLDRLYELAPTMTAVIDHSQRLATICRDHEKPASAARAGGWLARARAWLMHGEEAVSTALWPRLLPAAVAAVVLIAVLMQPQSPGGLAWLAEIEPAPYVHLDTRGGGAAQQRYRNGMQLYTEGRYGAAVEPLSEAVRIGETQAGWRSLAQARLYLGVSLILDDRPAAAVPHLEHAASSPVRPVADRARWYLAQAQLLLDAPAAARRHLEQLAGASPAYGERATRQLTTINATLGERAPD
jgi:hypothetical protein